MSIQVKQCLRTDHHNWKHCPWRHPGETAAQRRHPSVHKPTFCINLKMAQHHMRVLTSWSVRYHMHVQAGECTAGDNCPFSHNTFEMSLHPLRYKTTLCNLGDNSVRFLLLSWGQHASSAASCTRVDVLWQLALAVGQGSWPRPPLVDGLGAEGIQQMLVVLVCGMFKAEASLHYARGGLWRQPPPVLSFKHPGAQCTFA
ncbi:hypothetical protein COO60DRAFT_1458238 [Scenedesmus sp. NREL 46B-D3]|nr:hypothetical protein COO60DRAFT_1458238 [Scenedesmus sp. NREL 46B-D3]